MAQKEREEKMKDISTRKLQDMLRFEQIWLAREIHEVMIEIRKQRIRELARELRIRYRADIENIDKLYAHP